MRKARSAGLQSSTPAGTGSQLEYGPVAHRATSLCSIVEIARGIEYQVASGAGAIVYPSEVVEDDFLLGNHGRT